MARLWSCGKCGAATEAPDRHRAWHAPESVVLQVAIASTAHRCLTCHTLVLHKDVHVSWHLDRGDGRPAIEDGVLVG